MGDAPVLHSNNTLNRFNTAKTDSLIASQQRSARKLLRSADCYQQKFIKFPQVGIFHSYAELLHAALLEADKEVESFVPQPFLFRIGKKRYPPDCYFIKNGKRFIAELKPLGKLSDETKIPMEEFCRRENMTFLVLSNESVMEQEQLALNWLKIIRTLNSALDIPTFDQEQLLMDRLFHEGECELGDIVFKGDRLDQKQYEIALFRLAHKGCLTLDLEQKYLSYSTKVSLCI